MANAEQVQLTADLARGSQDVGNSSGQSEIVTLSKNQQKKLQRYEQKLAYRMQKRKHERERKKEKRKQAIEQGVVLPPCRKKLRKSLAEPIDITLVIDSSFEEHMIENDIRKLVKQIQHCYAINRRSSQPFKYCVSSYGGKLKEIVENLEGTPSWNVQWCEESYEQTFPKEDIVYLAAESENVLSTLEKGKVYVIGGLVDHNSKKGLCYKLASERGIAHAQLPISDYIDMKCRKVLTIDHVFEILQKFHERNDWESAFFSVIPKRKGAQCKSTQPLSTDVTGEQSDTEGGSSEKASPNSTFAEGGSPESILTDSVCDDANPALTEQCYITDNPPSEQLS